MNTDNVSYAHTYKGKLISLKKKGNLVLCGNRGTNKADTTKNVVSKRVKLKQSDSGMAVARATEKVAQMESS